MSKNAWVVLLLILVVASDPLCGLNAQTYIFQRADFSTDPGITGTVNEAIATGDFNGDGIGDLAIARQGSDVAILLGNPDPTFVPPKAYATASFAIAIAVGDLNNDAN